MGQSTIEFRIDKRITDEALFKAPIKAFIGKAARVVHEGLFDRAPIDSGNLRAALSKGMETHDDWAKITVGGSTFYASILNEGGPMRGPGKPPPGKAIGKWAGRVGTSIPPAAIARAIGKRGPSTTELHYASGPFKRKPTKDWWDSGIADKMPQLEGLKAGLADDIRAAWREAGGG